MKTQREVPFLRLLVPLVAGIVAALWADTPQWGKVALYAVLCSFPLLVMLSQKKWPYAYRWVFGLAAFCWLYLLGYGLSVCRNELHAPLHFSRHLTGRHHGVAVVNSVQEQKAGKRLQCRLRAIAAPALVPGEGQLLVILRDSAANVEPGDTIIFRNANIRRIQPPLNPDVFDFSRYWHYRNYHYQTSLQPDQWLLAAKVQRKNLWQWAEQCRSHYVAVLRQYLPGDDEWAVGCALLLGAKDAMTEEVTQAYSRTGAMHALAVSGMHVAIVWLAMSWLLYPLRLLGKPGKYAAAIILITGVWAYAVFTGASSSALRAAAMVSFLIIGQSFNRKHSPFNTLAASAFVLLCANPYLLMDAGFQLSYLAVAGILVFDKPLYKCWYAAPRWVDYLWRLTCVSVAAQLATFPISLYYFHQFPFYFWLSGWVVVPASTILLYWGGVLLVFHPVAAIAAVIGKGFYYFIWMVNKAVFAISDMPGAVADQAWISQFGVITLYIALLMLAIALMSGQGRWLLWMGLSLLAAAADRGLTHWKALYQREIVVFHVPNATLIDCYDGRRAYSYATLPPDHTLLKRSAGPCRNKRLINEINALSPGYPPLHTHSFRYQNRIIQFHQLTVAIIDSSYQHPLPATLHQVDLLALSGNPAVSVKELQAHFDIQLGIIADASNSYRNIDNWARQCTESGITFFDVKKNGAFVRKF